MVNHLEKLHQIDNDIPAILHGPKNVFIKKRYLNNKKDYQNYFVINTSKETIKSHTIRYYGTPALRRFYSNIPSFVPSGVDNEKIKEFRDYVAALNEDIINFLSEKISILKEPDNPLALYIIPELVSNAVKSSYLIEKKLSGSSNNQMINQGNMIEVVCLMNREKPGNIDIIMRNYAQFYEGTCKKIKEALNCRWTNRFKLRKEKCHRENAESSEYGLPSIHNAIRKFYQGELFYDGYDDSYAGFGAYQFTMRLPTCNSDTK